MITLIGFEIIFFLLHARVIKVENNKTVNSENVL